MLRELCRNNLDIAIMRIICVRKSNDLYSVDIQFMLRSAGMPLVLFTLRPPCSCLVALILEATAGTMLNWNDARTASQRISKSSKGAGEKRFQHLIVALSVPSFQIAWIQVDSFLLLII